MENIINKKSIDKCLEYTENKKEFLNLMKELKVYRNFQKYDKFFDDDKEERNIYRFTFKRNRKSTSILFGDSIHNTLNNEVPDLYDILTCVGSDLSLALNSRDFEDFCSELGYDSDSIKALKIYKKLYSQYNNFKKKNILTEDEIFILPN